MDADCFTRQRVIMAWLAIDEDGQEILSRSLPVRNIEEGAWISRNNKIIELRRGAIETLTGKSLTWLDEPIML